MLTNKLQKRGAPMTYKTRKFITIWEDTWHEMVKQMRPEETPDAFLRRLLGMAPRTSARKLRKDDKRLRLRQLIPA